MNAEIFFLHLEFWGKKRSLYEINSEVVKLCKYMLFAHVCNYMQMASYVSQNYGNSRERVLVRHSFV